MRRLLVMIFAAALLFAAGQSRKLSAQCRADGPTLDETVQYINSQGTNVSYDVTKGVLIHVLNANKDFKETAPFMALDCSAIQYGVSDGGGTVQVWCLNKAMCEFTDVGNSSHADNIFLLPILTSDPEALARIGKAVSHLLFLLQTEYRKQHDNPNDPFSH